MTGNATDAALAATHPAEHYLGEGCSRAVYLINGVVYKVEIDFFGCNTREYTNGMTMRDLMIPGYRIPNMTLYKNVLAMEYIDGIAVGSCSSIWTGLPCEDDGYCIDADTVDALNLIGWDDPAYGNAIIDNATGLTYLVDVA